MNNIHDTNSDRRAAVRQQFDVILHEVIVRAQREAADNQEDANMIPHAEYELFKIIDAECLAEQQKLLKDLADNGEIHHSVYDYRVEAIRAKLAGKEGA